MPAMRDGVDKPRGGGSYVTEDGFGHEAFNCQADQLGVYLGYVGPGRAA